MSAVDYEADAAGPEQGDTLARITRLAALLVEQQAAVSAAEEELASRKADLLRTETEDLPGLMEELGVTELKLRDGSKVTVKRDVTCALTEERRDAGLAWLDDHGFGGLIKTALTLEFGRDEGHQAVAAAEVIAAETHRPVTMKRGVHAATLKAFVQEQLAAGALPAEAQELFAVRPFPRAKLTPPKLTLRPRAGS